MLDNNLEQFDIDANQIIDRISGVYTAATIANAATSL